MKKLLKKIFLPIFLSVLCGFLCGKLMFSIYEDKEKNILTSNVIYLLEDTSYNDYNTMTKNRDNIDKIEKAYNKDFKIVEYLLSDDEINNKLDEYDKKIGNTSDNDEIKLLVEELNGIYKGRDDIKMVKIS